MSNKVVYGWFDGEECFYIGIGSTMRPYSLKGRNRHCRFRRSKAEKNQSFLVKVLYEKISWEKACEIECQLIQQYGRRDLGTGSLTNMTSGGEGHPNPSPESRKKMSIAKTGRNHPRYGKEHTKEARLKMSASHTGKNHSQWGTKHSQSHKENIRKSMYRPVMTPAGRFESCKAAYNFYDVSQRTFTRWLKDDRKPEFYKVI